jgi:hypothetical protein
MEVGDEKHASQNFKKLEEFPACCFGYQEKILVDLDVNHIKTIGHESLMLDGVIMEKVQGENLYWLDT